MVTSVTDTHYLSSTNTLPQSTFVLLLHSAVSPQYVFNTSHVNSEQILALIVTELIFRVSLNNLESSNQSNNFLRLSITLTLRNLFLRAIDLFYGK